MRYVGFFHHIGRERNHRPIKTDLSWDRGYPPGVKGLIHNHGSGTRNVRPIRGLCQSRRRGWNRSGRGCRGSRLWPNPDRSIPSVPGSGGVVLTPHRVIVVLHLPSAITAWHGDVILRCDHTHREGVDVQGGIHDGPDTRRYARSIR